MSARAELKAKSVKRFQKRNLRHLKKGKANHAKDDSSDEDESRLRDRDLLPTPSDFNAMENGTKSKKKSKGDKPSSQTPIGAKFLPELVFENLSPIAKCSWTGPPGEDEPSEELKNQRKNICVVVKGSLASCPPPVLSIQSEHLPPQFKQVFQSLNISTPTPVQMQCWPAILSGANVLGIAPTGSGKTLAYSLPVIPHIKAKQAAEAAVAANSKAKSAPKSTRIAPSALILVPTRELAIQVSAVLKPLKRICGLFSAAVFGGQDKDDQLDSLTANGGQLHILVATPGRLLDFITNSKILVLSEVTYLVIDEADRMLMMGFFDQLNAISGQIRPDRQTLLFSATFPGKLREIADSWVEDSVVIRCNAMEFQDKNNRLVQQMKEKEREQQQLQVEGSAAAATAAAASAAEGEGGKKRSLSDEEGQREGKKVDAKKAKVEAPVTAPAAEASSSSAAPSAPAQIDNTPVGSNEVFITPSVGAFAKHFSTSLTISKTVAQHIHVCAAHKKPRLLLKHITTAREAEKAEKLRQPGAMIIFCNKIKTLKFVHDFLTRQDVKAEVLHGQLQQNIREATLNNFKAGKTNIMIATDVAARGIHIKRLRYVVNYDFPTNLEQYCHRVGRTGRQGESGAAYSLITRNMAQLSNDLIALLNVCGQTPEPNLLKLAQDFNDGLIEQDADEEPDDGKEE